MKKLITILIWLTSLSLAAQPTATLKIGDIIDPVSDTLLVPVICEQIEPLTGNNNVTIQWYIRYSYIFLNGGEPGEPATLINFNPLLLEECISSTIIEDVPTTNQNTIAFTCNCPSCGEIFAGDTLFDIRFIVSYPWGTFTTYINWSNLGSEETEMYNNEGNEFLLTLENGTVLYQPPKVTLKIGTINNPQPGEILVPVTCEEYYNPVGGLTLSWFIAYDTAVLYAGEPDWTLVTLTNYYDPIYPNCLVTNIMQDHPLPGWNTTGFYWSCACCGEIAAGEKFFDIVFNYTEGITTEPNLIWTTSIYGFPTSMEDDYGDEFLLTLVDGYAGPASNDVTFHVTSIGNDLEGAWVTVGPLTLPTNASGIAVFSLENGDYNYTVTKEGFADAEGSFTVAGAPVQNEVEMEPCWDIVLHLIDMNGLTITDSALVIVNNDTVWSTTGSPSFCVTDLTINYEVYIEGYYPNIGVMTIPPYPVILELIMNPILYGVTFFVNCCGEPLEGIMLTIGTITVVTGPDGLAAFNLTEGDYTIEINGYIFTFSVPETTYVDADICSEVTFQVKDEQGNPLENVLIDVDGSYLITDFNGEADTCLQVGSYTYEATKLGYVIQTGTFEVDTTSQTIEIVMQCESYPVSVFCSTFCLNDFEGLVFYINGEIVTNGGTIWLCNGDYSLSMGILDCPEWWPGYYGAFTVSGSAITISVELPSGITIPKVTFHVTSTQGGNIQGAEVVVEEDTLYTNSSGEATFCMTGGDHYYSVAKENYDTINGIFNFPCENITIEVLMDPVAINNINSSDFRLYPNPSNGKFFLETTKPGNDPIELQVMDLTGRIVYERNPTISERFEIDLSGQQQGMYFLRFKTEKENYTQKLIIQ